MTSKIEEISPPKMYLLKIGGEYIARDVFGHAYWTVAKSQAVPMTREDWERRMLSLEISNYELEPVE